MSRLACLTIDVAGGGTPNCSPTASGNDQALTFSYNPAGQIVSTTRANDAYAWTGHYNVDRSYAVNGLNQLTTAGSTVLGYDGRGNLISSGGTSVWSRHLMVHYPCRHGRMRYGTGSTRERPYDSGGPSSDTA